MANKMNREKTTRNLLLTLMLSSLVMSMASGCGEHIVSTTGCPGGVCVEDDSDMGWDLFDSGQDTPDFSSNRPDMDEPWDEGFADFGQEEADLGFEPGPEDMGPREEVDQGMPPAPEDMGSEPMPPPPKDMGSTPPPPPQSFIIRFATYNVRTSNLNNSAWGDTHVGWDGNDAARMRKAADTIAGQRLTVVAAQEMRAKERREVLTRLKNAHNQNWGHTTQKQGADDTFVLFDKSVWKLIRQEHYKIPLQPGLRDRYQVGALLEHKATKRRIWVYSVHFAAGGSSGANAREVGARRTMQSIKNRAASKNLPFILGGDFNAVASSPVGRIFRNSGFMRYTREIADKKVNNGCKTFNGQAGTAGKQACPGGAASHIDHVWVGKMRMKVKTYKVVANTTTSQASDHNPVVTILEQP